VIRHRPTVAVVDLAAVRHNVRALRPKGAELMAVVKANGYGHGAVPVARAALEAGATWLGVALVEEGVLLRDAGLTAPVLVLTQCPPGSEKEALAAGLTPTVYTEDGLARLADAAGAVGGSIGVHVKVDTGMHRVGLPPESAVSFAGSVSEAGLDLEGLWTHFAMSEELDDPFTEIQLRRFLDVVDRLKAAGVRPRYLHAANTGAAIAHPSARLDLVRVGLGMYGLLPGPGLKGMAALRPAMSWRSAVVLAKRVAAWEGISYGLRYRLDRESTIATVPVGYADGYSRVLGGRAEVLIRGRRYRVAGTITMDQLMVDCGDDSVEGGDEVVLIGRQDGEEITADEVASWMGTVNYEIVCMVSERVPREYVDQAPRP
jgi:alanine racemase